MINLMWVLLYAVLVMSWGWAWQRRSHNIGVVDVLWARAWAPRRCCWRCSATVR